MTHHATQSLAAIAVLLIAIGLWAPTLASVSDGRIAVAIAATPEMA